MKRKLADKIEVCQKYDTTVGKVLVKELMFDVFDRVTVVIYKKMEQPVGSAYRYGATPINEFVYSYLLSTFPDRIKERNDDLSNIVNNTIKDMNTAKEQKHTLFSDRPIKM